MQKRPDDPIANDQLAERLLRALNHPLRRRIVNGLAQEPGSATKLSRSFGVPLANVAYHLIDVLFKECEVIRVSQRIPRRGAVETIFVLKPEVFVPAIDWPQIPERFRSGLRGLALANFQSAAVGALERDANGGAPNKPSIYKYRPARVDERGQREIRAAVAGLLTTVTIVENRCADLNPAELLNMIVGVAAFQAPSVQGSATE